LAALRKMLVVDDEPGMRQLLQSAFQERGFEVVVASNGDRAVDQLANAHYDLVITDLKMPGRDGFGVLRAVKGVSADTKVIIITAYGSIEKAVEAMQMGAADFIAKPFKLAEIELKVDKLIKRQNGAAKAAAGGNGSVSANAPKAIVGESEQTREVLRMVDKIGPSKSSVLIVGPSGTGKELVAKAIHDASPRKDKPFIALNCASLAHGILESELFGHEKGAFTGADSQFVGRFERAHGGTLFLDEVGEIDPGIQTKLLRVLQEGEFERVGGARPISVDVRIVAATNRDLRNAIRVGEFREDFFYRLNVFSIGLEPLRRRTADIPVLVEYFLEKFSKETGKDVTEIDNDVLNFFLQYPWPGNVRELENVIERAVVLSEEGIITRRDLPPEMYYVPDEDDDGPEPMPSDRKSLVERTDKLEREMIAAALEEFHWNKTKTAKHLGLKRTTLQYKIRKYELE
jgi:DNA-binding NtrC family response regulator